MPLPPLAAADAIVASPHQLHALGRVTVDVGRRVEELAAAAEAALHNLAESMPRSWTAAVAPAAGARCAELLHAEGASLRSLGHAFSAAAAAYQAGDARAAAKLLAPTA